MAASQAPRLRLLHIRDEIIALSSRVSSLNFEIFQTDYIMVRATERAILIISEAAKALPDEMIARESGIDWRAIRSIGNILRHEYERVEPKILWSIISEEFPSLLASVERLLDEAF
jgi:uncharacterized protein with HEPN domain